MFTIEQLEEVARRVGQVLQYRLGRPVISLEMAEKLPSPFPPEKDLCRESDTTKQKSDADMCRENGWVLGMSDILARRKGFPPAPWVFHWLARSKRRTRLRGSSHFPSRNF